MILEGAVVSYDVITHGTQAGLPLDSLLLESSSHCLIFCSPTSEATATGSFHFSFSPWEPISRLSPSNLGTGARLSTSCQTNSGFFHIFLCVILTTLVCENLSEILAPANISHGTEFASQDSCQFPEGNVSNP